MKNPSIKTTAERYNWLLNHEGSHEKVMQAAYAELTVQQKSKNQDHPDIKRNIAKVQEIINYGKNLKTQS